jgi:DNA-binding IclR family transcriptional regulator
VIFDSHKPCVRNPLGKGIQSIEIGIRLIDALIDLKQPARLKELAQRAGISPSKARTYLVSFLRTGLLEQDEVSGLYTTGPKAVRLGLLALDNNKLLRSARLLVASMARETRQMLMLSAFDGVAPVIIESSESPDTLPITFRSGVQQPLWATATGCIYLAFLPESLVARFIDEQCQPDERELVEQSVKTARTAGIVYFEVARLGREITLHSHGAFAAPIFGRGGELEFVVTLLVSNTMDPAERDRLGQLLLERVKALSEMHDPGTARQEGAAPRKGAK